MEIRSGGWGIPGMPSVLCSHLSKSAILGDDNPVLPVVFHLCRQSGQLGLAAASVEPRK